MGILVQEWRTRVVQLEREKEEERVRRIGIEEELKIVKLALEECRIGRSAPGSEDDTGLVGQDDRSSLLVGQIVSTSVPIPNAVSAPPASDGTETNPANLCLSCSAVITEEQPTTFPSTPSNILLGIKGLHRLLADFQSALGASQEKVALLETLADELRSAKAVAIEESEEARSRTVKLESEIELIKAEDHGAGKVVERYM
jgi:hypothetical protein